MDPVLEAIKNAIERELNAMIEPGTTTTLWGLAEKSASAALSAIEAAGYVIVPREPSDAMADKGESSLICGPLPSDLETSPGLAWAHAKSCWRAMIEAHESEKPASPE